jgi:hypothetical protein
MYCLTRKPIRKNSCSETSLVALDLKTGDLKSIFQFAEGWSVAGGHPGEIGASRDGTYSLFLQNSTLKKAMLIRVQNGQVHEFPIGGDFYDPGIRYVFYLNSAHPQLVIFSKPRLYRLDLSGQVEELAKADSINVWQDSVLLFEPSGMKLFQVGEVLALVRQWPGKQKKSRRQISGYESRGVIFHVDRDYFWLDMEQQKEEKLELKSPPFTYQQNGDRFNVVLADGSTFTILELRSGKRRETLWDPGFQPAAIRISSFGLLVFTRHKYKVYPFNN